MFFPFLIASAIGLSLVKLGALSMQVAVLSHAFKAVLTLLVGLLLWLRLKGQ